MFNKFHENLNMKKKQVSRLISSKKYLQKPLKNILDPQLNEFADNYENREFIIQTVQDQPLNYLG